MIFYLIYITHFSTAFVYLNYLNTISLLFNSIFGFYTVLKPSKKLSLYYYDFTNYILKANILYQIIRLILFFKGDYIVVKEKRSYIFLVENFVIFSLILSILLYFYLVKWAKLYFFVLKSKILYLNSILILY